VGTGKTVTVTGLALSGANASDYSLSSSTAGAVGTITPATLTAALAGTVSKTYDTTNGATLAAGNYTLTGVLGSDTVTLNDPTAGTYDTIHVGTGKTVTVNGLALTGADASDYSLASTSTAGAVGAITPATLSAALTGTVSKTYDTTNSATLAASNYALKGVLGSDAVTLNDPTAGTYDNSQVGTAKTVSVTGLVISGANASDYLLASSSTAGAVGAVTPATLTAGLTGTVSKTYDNTTVATLAANNYTLSGVLGSDAVMLNDPTAGNYNTSQVGTGKTVSVTGLLIFGANASDYALAATTASGAIGTITAAIGGNVTPTTVIGGRYVPSAGQSTGSSVMSGAGTGPSGTDGGGTLNIALPGDVAGGASGSGAFGGNSNGSAGGTSSDAISGAGASGAASGTGSGSSSNATSGAADANGSTTTGATLANGTDGTTSSGNAGGTDATGTAVGADSASTSNGAGGPGSSAADGSGNPTAGTADANGSAGAIGGTTTGATLANGTDGTTSSGNAGGTDPSGTAVGADSASTSNGADSMGSTGGASSGSSSNATSGAADANGSAGATGGSTTGASPVDGASSTNSGGTTSSAITDDQITVTMVQSATTQSTGMVSISVPEEMVSSGHTVSFALPTEVVEAVGDDKLKVTQKDGKRLPSWLKYSPATKTFSANVVPAGALPTELLVSSGAHRWTLSITERARR
jgi:hypothetical protein